MEAGPVRTYRRPPITEAVIELRYAQNYGEEVVNRAAKRIRGQYTYEDEQRHVNVKVHADRQESEFEDEWAGVRLSSSDRTDIIIFKNESFLCSRLAPYNGWDEFCARAMDAWDAWTKVAGNTELARIGVRYLNRIDIPTQNMSTLRVEDYLNVWPRVPEDIYTADADLKSYTMQVVRPLGVDECSLLLNSGTIASPLIGFVSLLLDFDIFRETNLPRRRDELWALVNRIRVYKNEVFEKSITDRARALFDQ